MDLKVGSSSSLDTPVSVGGRSGDGWGFLLLVCLPFFVGVCMGAECLDLLLGITVEQ